ncbi:hypothetical protein ABW20_dc0106879 [Dactylellina cionopaga]|nr:hypothetical protein ABW20_dc0106879 [Dactylellina cionopaga]
MPTTRAFLMSGVGVLTAFSGPTIATSLATGFCDPLIALPITSILIIVVTAASSTFIYIKDRRASRRSIEKSAFGKVLNRQERKELKPQYKAAKVRVKANDKAERAALKAEEKIRKNELRKVIKDRIQTKLRELPLRLALGAVKFVTTLAAEIPKVTVTDLEADVQVVQGAVQPIPSVPGPDDLLRNRRPVIGGSNSAATNFATSPAGTIGNNAPLMAPPYPGFASPIINTAGSMPVTPI